MKLKYPKNITTLVSCLVLVNAVLLVIFLHGNNSKPRFDNTGNFSEIEQLKGTDLDFKQLSVFFTKLAESKGGEYAYKSLALATAHSYLAPNVDTHLLGHVVGDVLFKQDGLEGIKVCTNDLRNACSHSIVVGALLKEGVSALDKIVATCHLAPGGSGAYTMCLHGLGHGVLAYADYDMKKAVDLCRKTSPANSPQREFVECSGGVTMEMMAGVNDHQAWEKQSPNYFKKDDPLSPCDMDFMPKDAQPVCYTFLSPHLFVAAGANLQSPGPEDFKKAFSYCAKLPLEQKDNRRACFGGFGKEYVVLVNNRNVQTQSIENLSDDKLAKIYDWCSLGKTQEAIWPCLDSALQSLYWGGENKREIAIRYCGVIPAASDKSFCFERLIGAVAFYIKDHDYKKQFCEELPVDFKQNCSKIL